MPHVVERAPTGRAKCRGCGRPIAAGDRRFGERLPNPFADAEGAEMTHWFHLPCAAFKRPEPLLAALEADPGDLDAEGLAWLTGEARLGLEHHRVPRVDAASRAPSGRAACRACREPIPKGSWRLGLVYYEDGRFAPSGYIHAACAAEYLGTTAILARLREFSPALGPADWTELAATFS